MPVVSRAFVYSLIAIVCVLLLGISALLGVAYQRHQRLEDATIDFQRNIAQQEHKIVKLQEQLQNCDTTQSVSATSVTSTDTSWNTTTTPVPNSDKPVEQASPPKW